MKILKHIAHVILSVCCTLTACSPNDTSRIAEAKAVVEERPDSAYMLLKSVEYMKLNGDKDKADYILTHAYANIGMEKSLMTDTLLPKAIAYYNHAGDTVSASQAIIAQAYHLRAIEDNRSAFELLDSVYQLPTTDIEERKHINKILLDFSFKDKDFNRSIYIINRHISILNNEEERFAFEMKKISPLNSLGRSVEAVALCDSLFTSPSAPETGSSEWSYMRINYAASLGEKRATAQKAIEVLEDVLNRLGKEVPPKQLLELYIPMVNLQLNAGNKAGARKYVDGIEKLGVDKSEYDAVAATYLDFLKIVLDYEEQGSLSPGQFTHVAHHLRKANTNLEIKRQERDDALESAYDLSRHNYELTISQQRLWLTLSAVVLTAVLATAAITYISHKRRQRLVDAEEKIETLEELVKSANNAAANDKQGLLKKLLLQQLGILKTFAESPTSQNQEALRKISNIGNADSPSDALIKWDDLYPTIDELYENFHKRLLEEFPGLFSEREMNIVCLMKAGFSTKEIGVLVQQTSNSVYVSKTSIRKKLGLGSKGDILAHLETRFNASEKA